MGNGQRARGAGPGLRRDIARRRPAGPAALAGSAAVLAALVAQPAAAQQVDAGDQFWKSTLSYLENQKRWDPSSRSGINDVMGQDRSFNLSGGKRIGRFMFAPTLSTKLTYDDNLFNRSTDAEGDFYTEIAPGLSVSTETARHFFQVSAGLKAYKYAKYDEFDAIDRTINASAAINVNSAHVIYGTVAHALVHEDSLSYIFPDVVGSRQSTAQFDAAERTPVTSTLGEVGIRRDAGRLHGSLSAQFSRWDYKDIRITDGTTFDQDYRDLQALSGTARIGYRFSPGFELTTRFSSTRFDFLDPVSEYANGWQHEVSANLEFETGPLLQWQIGGGYAYRTYDDPIYASTGDYVARLKLNWAATERLTIKAEAQRRFNTQATPTGIDAALSHSVRASADLELYRNLIFTINGEYWNTDDLRSSVNSDVYQAGIRLKYFSAQNWVASVGYDYIERASDDPDLDLKRNQFWGRVHIRF
jgi:hypothetical protein